MRKNENLIEIIKSLKDEVDKGITFIIKQKEEIFISYKNLYDKSLQVLKKLQNRGIKTGDEVIFQIEDNRKIVITFWACVLGGMIPVPAAVGLSNQDTMSLIKIWSKLNNPYLVSEKNISYRLQEIEEADLGNKIAEINEKVLYTEEIVKEYESEYGQICERNNEDVAMIQFSSGSTGDPKGVAITHKNLMIHAYGVIKNLKITEKDSTLSWMSLIHNMGLILAHITNMAVGMNQYIMNMEAFLNSPTLWIKKASEYKVTQLYSATFAFNLFLKDYNRNIKNDWDLSKVRFIATGGENVNPNICNEFIDCLEKYGLKRNVICPGYGLAESTTVSAVQIVDNELNVFYIDRNFLNIGEKIKEVSSNDNRCMSFVSVGTPLENCLIKITDENDNTLSDSHVGYIKIKGGHVTKGYYNDIEATKNVFSTDGWLNTGDIGFIKDNKLVIVGREKDVIVVNAQNFYPSDIENVVKKEVEEIDFQDVAVINIEKENKESKDITLFTSYKGNLESFIPIIRKIKEVVSKEIRIQLTHIIPLNEIPKTASGKIKKKQLVAMYKNNEFDETINELNSLLIRHSKDNQPLNDVEKKIQNICEDILYVNYIEKYDNLFQFGLDSISMQRVVNRINKEFNSQILITDIMKQNTIHKLAEIVKDKSKNNNNNFYSIKEGDWDNIYKRFPLTEIQMSYLLGRSEYFELGDISTHLYMEIETELDMHRLNNSLQKVINRHPMLRTIILTSGEQQVLENVEKYIIDVKDLSNLDRKDQEELILKEREKKSHYVFDIGNYPMFEFKAFKLSETKNYLFIGIDLLIADGASIGIIGRELINFYNQDNYNPEDINISFRDYMIAYKNLKNTDIYNNDKKYWIDKIDNFPSYPKLPLKKKIRDVKKPHFIRKDKTIDKDIWEYVKNICKKYSITPSVLLCTLYAKVLSFWSNQPELTINLTTFNRYPFHDDVDKIVGDFTSSLLLDIDLKDENEFLEKAKDIQKTLMKSLQHRHFDGVEFIRELAKYNNKESNGPLFPIVFTSLLFDSNENGWMKIGKIKNTISQTSQVFLDNQSSEVDGNLYIAWDYVNELFDEKLIDEMFNQYIWLIENISENIEGRLTLNKHDLEFIEKYNDTDKKVVKKALHQLFKEQVELYPDNKAVIFENKVLTYKELDEKSNQIALYLKGIGVKRNDVVGVIVEREPKTIENIIGILKAGGAYVPIDPQYPQERRNYILNNSKCSILLDIDFYDRNNICDLSKDGVIEEYYIDDLAYIIYTSGSTGKPKGVVITHQAAVNTIVDINERYSVTEKDRIMGISSMCFDLSVYDIFGALTTGATLVMIPDQRDIDNLAEVIEKEKITIWNSVPAIMDMMLDNAKIINNNVSKYDWDKIGQIKEEIYYWAPGIEWETIDDSVIIKEKQYYLADMFPKFYFITQKGVTLNELYEEFQDINKENLDVIIHDFIENKILICNILSPHELYSSQTKLCSHSYGETLFYDEEVYKKFKNERLNRQFKGCRNEKIILTQYVDYPQNIEKRQSFRTFEEKEEISFKVFSELLSVFKQKRYEDKITYYYASAGGLYPIDVFIYVKDNRIEGVEKGLYYYNPLDNSLNLVNNENDITTDDYYFTNKEIFKSSAFSIFFIYNADVTMPRYGGSGYFYGGIDSGIMVGTLTQVAELLDIGICSIGDMDFSRIREFFNLNKNQVLIHTVEGGLKPNIKEIKEKNYNEFKDSLLNSNDLNQDQLTKECEKEIELGTYNNENNTSLRLVLLSGDWIPLKLYDKIRNKFVNSEVISLGGATEASIWSIYYPIKEIKKEWTSIPYGMPLGNQKFYVLNYRMKLCPIGILGELCIGGIGIAKGYYRDEEKTKRAFINHPTLGPIYRTGDYGILKENGYIEFIGRKDQQVKIKGYRIELDEITNSLLKHKHVNNAAVINVNGKNNNNYLCAYVVCNEGFDVEKLRKYLSDKLPAYMVPQYIMSIEKLPLTSNGKVDKKALPIPKKNVITNKAEVVNCNEIEKKILEIWSEILEMPNIGINDNFFEIGGDSRMIVRAHSVIEQYYPNILKITDMFTNSTVAKLAKFIINKTSNFKEKVKFKTLQLPAAFFTNNSGEYAEYSSFEFNIEDLVYGKLVYISENEKISIKNILVSLYVYLLSQITDKQEINIQTAIKDKNIINELDINLKNIENFSDLFKIVYGKLNSKELIKYSKNEIKSIIVQKDSISVAVLFSSKDILEFEQQFLNIYDIVFEMNEDSQELKFICEYNNSRLSKEKIKELINGYIALINFFIKEY